ncbi:EAL domain-containing protein, partial [Pseudomonadota bacterium]
GTGYSSFVYLKKFPVDVVKLDHTFMQDIVHDTDAGLLAAGMISMAKGLRLTVVAEGIETQDQLEFLREHKCDKAQGYLFHKPLIETAAKAYFDETQALANA